jgi:hypothetical protein
MLKYERREIGIKRTFVSSRDEGEGWGSCVFCLHKAAVSINEIVSSRDEGEGFGEPGRPTTGGVSINEENTSKTRKKCCQLHFTRAQKAHLSKNLETDVERDALMVPDPTENPSFSEPKPTSSVTH